jgi:hypothetical protein
MIEIELHVLHPACLKIIQARRTFWWKQMPGAGKMWSKYAAIMDSIKIRQYNCKMGYDNPE